MDELMVHAMDYLSRHRKLYAEARLARLISFETLKSGDLTSPASVKVSASCQCDFSGWTAQCQAVKLRKAIICTLKNSSFRCEDASRTLTKAVTRPCLSMLKTDQPSMVLGNSLGKNESSDEEETKTRSRFKIRRCHDLLFKN